MAAPLKRVLHGGCRCMKQSLPGMRLMSSTRDRDGPPPWAAQQIPTGATFTAMKMAKMQNKEIWMKRQDYVNRPWKQVLENYSMAQKKRKEQSKGLDDEQEAPPKLLMVRQVKTTKWRPYWEKNTLRDLGIKEMFKPVVVKNKQVTHGQLKVVKHLVEIFPVTFPYGEPKTGEDLESAYLCDNGAFIVKKRIGHVEQLGESLPVAEEIPENKFEMKQEFIDQLVELRKVHYQINQEYYPTKYVYRKNEDKKEWRYKGDTDIGHDMTWH